MPRRKKDPEAEMQLQLLSIRIMVVRVKNCERCGRDHPDLDFEHLASKKPNEFWAKCPTTRQPMIINAKQFDHMIDDNKDAPNESVSVPTTDGDVRDGSSVNTES